MIASTSRSRLSHDFCFQIALYPDSDNKKNIMREAMAASERIWENSARNGNDRMTMEDIDAEVAAARADRKKRVINQ